MAHDIPMIAYWMGEPLAKLPRKKLIEIITTQAQELTDIREREMRRSVAEVHALAEAAKARIQAKHWWEQF